MNEVLNQILNVVLTGLSAIVVILIKKGVQETVAYLQVAKTQASNTIGTDNYNFWRGLAIDIFLQVEEKYGKEIGTVTDKKIADYSTMFKAYCVKHKLPFPDDYTIDFWRQTAAGEFNKDKAHLLDPITPENTESPKTTSSVIAQQ